MIKPLVFNTPAPTPAPVAKAGGPKPLVFAPAPPPVQQPTVQPVAQTAKRLSFPPSAPPPPAPAVSQGPRAVFEQQMSPIARSAVAELKRSYPDDYAKRGPLLERQINQLLPLEVTKIMAWATKTLQQMTDVSGECSKVIREFYDANGTTLIEETLKVLQGKQNFFEKLVGNKNIADCKAHLVVLKSTLDNMLPRTTQLLQSAEEVAQKLVNKMMSLRVIGDVCGKLPDAMLDDALHDRQTLIVQSSTQAQLTIQQLQDVRKQLVDQIGQIERLLNATIPAFEAARARR